MNPRSLAWRTDLIFPRFDGEILDRGRYLVIRTPSNPTFYWGNFLLFDGPPAPGDDEPWPPLFPHPQLGPARLGRHSAAACCSGDRRPRVGVAGRLATGNRESDSLPRAGARRGWLPRLQGGRDEALSHHGPGRPRGVVRRLPRGSPGRRSRHLPHRKPRAVPDG